MKPKIIPTVFAKNEKDFQDRFSKLTKISRDLQIDFMDGKFVKGKFMNFDVIPNLNRLKKHNFEAHLMIQRPEKYIKMLKDKGFKKIIFHYSAGDNIKTFAQIKNLKMKSFIALNPKDNIRNASYLFDLADGVLIMGVNPGKEHQTLINSTYEKIKLIRNIDNKIPIQIDGGVNPENIRKLLNAGANIFNTGSFVSENENPKKALLRLKRELRS